MATTTTSYQMRSVPQAPPSSSPSHPAQKQAGGPGGPAPRAGTQVTFLTQNYSVAPGPAWIELVNQTAFTATGTIKIALPPRGAGEYLAQLQLPIAVTVVAPTVITSQAAIEAMADLERQQQQEAKQKAVDAKQQQQQKQELEKKQQEAEQQHEQKMEEADKEKEQRKEKQQQEQQKEAEQQAKDFAVELAAGTVLVPPLSTTQQAAQVAELWLADWKVHGITDLVGPGESGMSKQGFPGLPRPVAHTTALPSTLGINGAKIDTTVSPAELDITFAGSGSVPAKSRWLIFTITGV